MKYLLYFKEALPVMMYFAFVLVGGSTMANSIQSWQIKSGKCGWWIEKLVVCASLVRCYHTGKILVLIFFYFHDFRKCWWSTNISSRMQKKEVCFWCVENFCIDLPLPPLFVCVWEGVTTSKTTQRGRFLFSLLNREHIRTMKETSHLCLKVFLV